MIIGFNYPTPIQDNAYSSNHHRTLLDEVRPDSIRFAFHHLEQDQAKLILDTHGDNTVIPIIDGDYDAWQPDLRANEQWAKRLTSELAGRAPFLEVWNEPWTLHRMDPYKYAQVVKAVRQGTNLPIAIAGDFVRPGGWFHPDWMRWWGRVVSSLDDEDFQLVSVHPYRACEPYRSIMRWPNYAHRNPGIFGWWRCTAVVGQTQGRCWQTIGSHRMWMGQCYPRRSS